MGKVLKTCIGVPIFYALFHCRIGHDLAVMSLSNHTILSRGTFSYWSGFLAGGSTVLPCHFRPYRTPLYDTDEMCHRHPLQKPLERLYNYTN